MERKILNPSEGMVLTNGKGTYGKTIYLADTDSVENYREITEKEYQSTIAESEEMPND